MKKNISDTISKLEKLYFEIPDDFALQNARVFCRKAINEMKEIQNKRNKREMVQQQQINQQYSYPDMNSAKLALKELDRLIAMENKKLEKPKNNNNVSSDDQFLAG